MWTSGRPLSEADHLGVDVVAIEGRGPKLAPLAVVEPVAEAAFEGLALEFRRLAAVRRGIGEPDMLVGGDQKSGGPGGGVVYVSPITGSTRSTIARMMWRGVRN
jgi:hypothetical protein